MSQQINKSKKLDRIDHVDATIKRKGSFSMVPNCIYEMGLSRIEREVWCYLHRIPEWEHPIISDMPKDLGVGKSQLMDALVKLESLNMIAVQGKGKGRIFHLPSPAYWKHPLPQSIYGFAKDEDKPVNIGEGIFEGAAVNRPKQDEKNRPKQDEKKNRPKQDEKSSQIGRKIVPNRTKSKQQTHDAVGVEASLKTLKDSQDSFKTQGASEGQTSLPGGGLTKAALIGELASLYVATVKKDVFEAVIVAMEKKASRERILEVIEAQRDRQDGLLPWGVRHKSMWLAKLTSDASPSQEPTPSKTDWAAIDREAAEWRKTSPSLDAMPF